MQKTIIDYFLQNLSDFEDKGFQMLFCLYSKLINDT